MYTDSHAYMSTLTLTHTHTHISSHASFQYTRTHTLCTYSPTPYTHNYTHIHTHTHTYSEMSTHPLTHVQRIICSVFAYSILTHTISTHNAYTNSQLVLPRSNTLSRQLSLQLHPDKNDNLDATEKFRKVRKIHVDSLIPRSHSQLLILHFPQAHSQFFSVAH